MVVRGPTLITISPVDGYEGEFALAKYRCFLGGLADELVFGALQRSRILSHKRNKLSLGYERGALIA